MTLIFAFAGNTLSQDSQPALLPIPFPELSGLEQTPRKILSSARTRFEQAARSQTGRELGIAYGRLGMVYQNWQFHPETEAAYLNAIALVPGDAHWPYYLALHFEETGELEKAIEYYQKSLDLNPDYPNTWLRLAEVLLELNNLPAAQRGYEAALQLQPGMVAAYAGIGTVALRQKNYPRAIEYLSRALDLQPEATQLHYRLAQAYRKTGDIEKAREHIAKSGRRIASAPDPWIDIMKTRSKSAQHFVDLGVDAMQQRDYQTAAQNFNIAVTMEPENAATHVKLAAAFAFLGQKRAALAAIDKALVLAPGDLQAALMKGNILESLDRYEDARVLYQAAVDLEPDDLRVRFLFANNLMRNGQYVQAALQYGVQRQAEAENVTVRYWQALAFVAANRCRDALVPLAEALRLQSDIAELVMASSRIHSTCGGASTDQQQTALSQAQQLYAYHPNGDYSETLAMAMAANGRFPDAAAYQAEAMSSGTDDASVLFMRQNLEHYENGRAAEKPWPDNSPVFFPPLARTR